VHGRSRVPLTDSLRPLLLQTVVDCSSVHVFWPRLQDEALQQLKVCMRVGACAFVHMPLRARAHARVCVCVCVGLCARVCMCNFLATC